MKKLSLVVAKLALAVVLLAAPGAASAQAAPAPSQDPVDVGPTIYRQIFENERIRTLEITFKPGSEIGLHSHPEHSVYVTSAGKLRITGADGKVTDLEAKVGDLFYLPAESHSAKNIGKSTVKAVVTELKEAPPSGTLSGAQRAELLELYRRSTQELVELVASTPDELWDKKPAPDRWSVAETVEHIAAAEPMLFSLVAKAMADPVDADWASVHGKTSIEQLIGFVTDRSQKFPAPEPLRPAGGLSRADALGKYGAARAVTVEFARRVSEPVQKHLAPMPFGKMTVHHLLAFIAGHNLRHNAQIRETLEQLRAQ